VPLIALSGFTGAVTLWTTLPAGSATAGSVITVNTQSAPNTQSAGTVPSAQTASNTQSQSIGVDVLAAPDNPNATPPAEQQTIGVNVYGTTLSVSETLGTQNSTTTVGGAPTGLAPIVLPAGESLLHLVVNDSRGTLVGWKVSGVLEGDHSSANWDPSVRLTTPAGVPGGPSGIPAEVRTGSSGSLGSNPAILCEAPAGGGGGSFTCDADVSVPTGSTLDLTASPAP